MNNIVRVSDIIGEDYKTWTNEECIFIEAGTDTGKSYFIKNILYEYCKENNKKILLLSNRDNLKQQNLNETKDKTNVITCMNYQQMEYQNKYEWKMLLDTYVWACDFDYVVMDECQYFMLDSTFSQFTDLALYNILQFKKPIKIFMSATPTLIKQYLEDIKVPIKEYKLEKDYSYINRVVFYYDQKLIEENVLDKLETNEKMLYFLRSAERAYDLHKKHKNSSFICSKYNKTYSKYICQDELDSIIENEKFNNQILFTTLCMDNGINIKDKDIKYIACDIDDVDNLLQAIGRYRRIDSTSEITVFIKAKGNEYLGGIMTTNNKLLKIAEELDKLGTVEFIKHHPREDYSRIIYDVVDENDNNNIYKKVHEIMRVKCKERVIFAEKCIDLGKDGFCKFIIPYFNRGEYEILDDSLTRMTIDEYLESIVGKELLKEDQVKLKEVFKDNGLNDKTMGIHTLNGKLKDIGSRFKIVAKRTSKQRFWTIQVAN